MDKLLELIYRILSVALVATNVAEKVATTAREFRRQRMEGGNKQE